VVATSRSAGPDGRGLVLRQEGKAFVCSAERVASLSARCAPQPAKALCRSWRVSRFYLLAGLPAKERRSGSSHLQAGYARPCALCSADPSGFGLGRGPVLIRRASAPWEGTGSRARGAGWKALDRVRPPLADRTSCPSGPEGWVYAGGRVRFLICRPQSEGWIRSGAGMVRMLERNGTLVCLVHARGRRVWD
jgi:hypothetical protein